MDKIGNAIIRHDSDFVQVDKTIRHLTDRIIELESKMETKSKSIFHKLFRH